MMSRTELSELLDRGAGPAPDGVDTVALWQRGRRRRRAKRMGPVGVAVAIILGVVLVRPVWDSAPPVVDIAPADRPATVDLPEVVLPDPQAARTELGPLREATASVVVATYDGSAVFVDVDRQTSTRRQLTELAPGDPPYRLIAGDRLVLWGGEQTYAMDPDPEAAPEMVNDESTWSVFVPSGHPDRFWVRLGTTDGRPAPVSQLSVDGEVLIPAAESPGGNLAIGLRDSVVLQTDDELIVWDPQTGQVIERVSGPFPMGTDGQRFAWCDASCRRLSITDPAAGSTRLLAQVPDGMAFTGYQGQLSPDGRYLAAPLCETASQRCALVVLDLDDERATTVADGWLAPGATPAWSPDSRWVFVTLADGRLATYWPGASQAAIVQVDSIDAPYGFGVIAADNQDAADEEHGPNVVRLDASDVTPLAAAATHDPSLKDHVVRDTDGLGSLWDMADVAGQAPELPEGTVGILVFAREAESSCRSLDDVVGVEIVAGEVVVLLDPAGEFLHPCPGPQGAHAWTAFAIAIPEAYDQGLTSASSRLSER